MNVYCDGNECRLLPRAPVTIAPPFEGDGSRPLVAVSNATADAPVSSTTLASREAKVGDCTVYVRVDEGLALCAVDAGGNNGANTRPNRPLTSGSEAVKSLTRIATTFEENNAAVIGSDVTGGVRNGEHEQRQPKAVVLTHRGVCSICGKKGRLTERGVCKACQGRLRFLTPPTS